MKRSRRICLFITFAILICFGLFVWPGLSDLRNFRSESVDAAVGKKSTEISSRIQNEVYAKSNASGTELEDGPISARATLTGNAGTSVQLAALDGEFARVLVEAGEVISIELDSSRFKRGQAIRIDADNGGSLNHRLGPIETMVAGADGDLSFTYAVGGHRGLYTVEISQGPVRELFEFWVGPERPRGNPGPARDFASQSTRS